MDIRSKVGFAKDSPPKAHHSDKNRTLTKVLIVDKGGLHGLAVAGPTTIDFAYCPGVCNDLNNPDDKITFTADPNGQNLVVSNSPNAAYHIGDEAGGNSHFSHQPPDWMLNQITVAGKPYTCGKKGDPCLAIMVYHKP